MSNDVYADKLPIRTGELTQMVIEKYGGANGAANLGKYIPLTQVASSTGGANNIADVMVLGAWHSSGNELEGFEVKISRADWLNEVKDPNKSTGTKKYCDRWWLVIADESMVKKGELPEDWGMMVPIESKLKIIKKAPLLVSQPMSHDFVASLLRTDARGNIPLDVHADQMKDLQRKYESEYKQKYAGLLDFVKQLNKELGIDLSHDDYRKTWWAKIGDWEIIKQVNNGGSHLTAEQIAAAIKIVLRGDMRTIKWQLESVTAASEQILEIAKAFKVDPIQQSKIAKENN